MIERRYDEEEKLFFEDISFITRRVKKPGFLIFLVK
jgi:hypothetical protein